MPPLLLAVSMGCPAGVGPEVAVRAAARLHRAHPDARVVLVGDPRVARAAAAITKTSPRRLVEVADAKAMSALEPRQIAIWQPSARLSSRVLPGQPTAAAGAAQLAWIDAACDLVSAGQCAALVTAPVSKEVIAGSGGRRARAFRGHTEHLAERVGAKEVVMAFHAAALTTALVTTHLPLAGVPRALTPARVATSCFWLADLLQRVGRDGPVAVAGLNPHAGEGGLLGREEGTIITPGMRLARRRLKRRGVATELVGPLGAESAYRLALEGQFAGVVAMYHDQATIAGKLTGFGEMVNVTLGLPIIRTSVDHGTAYDRAGLGTASSRGMSEALSLAIKLAKA